MTRHPWHKVFHPLSGADLPTLVGLLRRHGAPGRVGLARTAVALASATGRLPFTLAERAVVPLLPDPDPPVVIVGHPRSGTTHLHNLMAASGRFATIPPVLAGMPHEALGLGRVMRPFVGMYLPRTRLIDGVALTSDAPTEDEVALANMCGLSHFHALYMPRGFARTYARGLLLHDASGAEVAARARALRRLARVMARPRRGPLLLKNPAYTGQLGWLMGVLPGARVVAIHREPGEVFASARRATLKGLRELALQPWDEGEVVGAILDGYPRMMDAYARDAARVPQGRLVEVAYEDVVADPAREVARIWDALGLPGARDARRGVHAHMATLDDYRRGSTALAPAEARMVAERWGPHAPLHRAPARHRPRAAAH